MTLTKGKTTSAALAAQVKAIESEVARLQSAADQAEAAAVEAAPNEADYAAASERATAAKANWAGAKDRLERLRRVLAETLHTERGAEIAQMDRDLSAAHDARGQTIRECTSAEAGENKRHEAALTELSARRSAADNRIRQIESNLRKLREAQAADLSAIAHENSDRIGELQAQVNGLSDSIAAKRREVESARAPFAEARLVELRSKANPPACDVEQYERSIAAHEETRRRLRDEIAALDAERARVQALLDYERSHRRL